MKNKQQKGKEWPERSTEPSLPSHHRRNVHSVPPSIHRSRSLPPRFGKLLLMKVEHLILLCFLLTRTFLSTLQCATNGEARKQGNPTNVSAPWLTIPSANGAFQAQLSMPWTDTPLERWETPNGEIGGAIF